MDSNIININVNLIQWNCQSLRPKSFSFQSLLSQEKIHIAVLSETWLEPDSYFNINGYDTYRSDRADGYGGVAIVTHKSVKSSLCLSHSPNNGIELLHVKINNCRHIENVISIYCPSTVHTTQNDWDFIFSLCNGKSVILGDFNAHHTNWSCRTDQRGFQIFDCMLDHNFISLNNGEPTRIRLANGCMQQSSPDVSFVSSDLGTFFTWKITNESLGSDHLIIKISGDLSLCRDVIRKRNFKKSDWKSYATFLDKSFLNFNIPVEPQIFYNMFEQKLQTAANKFIPFVKIPQHFTNKFSPKHYWNAEMSKAVAERRLALAKFRACPSPNNLVTLKSKISEAQRIIRSGRCRSFQGFCSSIDKNASSSDLWRKMKWIKGHRTRSSSHGVDKEKVERLMNDLCPAYTCPPQPQFQSKNTLLEADITIQELINSIKNNDTAPGSDAVSFSMIKNLPISGKTILLLLFNVFFQSGFVPQQWREVNIVPIPKPGRDANSYSSLRPISLISCLCKILHAIINKRLEWFFEKQAIFPQNMVGFRKARSCYDNLTRLVSHIQIGFSKDLFTEYVFICGLT